MVEDWKLKVSSAAAAQQGKESEGSEARCGWLGAGPDTPPAFAAATRVLIGHGHRRIVLLTRAIRRLPAPIPSSPEHAFLRELELHGIPSGAYNLPQWKETISGFHSQLESLFQVSPPSALIIEQAPFFVAAQQFLARRGLRVPEDVSLVCTDSSPDFAWCQPAISHIRWDSRPVATRIAKWAANVSRGKKDIRQTDTKAEFVPGGTIGPVGGSAFRVPFLLE